MARTCAITLAVLISLATSSEGLQCYSCSSTSSTECSGPLVDCDGVCHYVSGSALGVDYVNKDCFSQSDLEDLDDITLSYIGQYCVAAVQVGVVNHVSLCYCKTDGCNESLKNAADRRAGGGPGVYSVGGWGGNSYAYNSNSTDSSAQQTGSSLLLLALTVIVCTLFC